jgi:plastocyanin
MFTRFLKILRFLLAGLLAAGLAACNAVTAPPAQIQPGIAVDITATSCPSTVVKIGDQVTWTNRDRAEHVVQARTRDGRIIFDSGTLQRDDTFAFVFSQAGTYEYACSAGGDLAGTVTVEP